MDWHADMGVERYVALQGRYTATVWSDMPRAWAAIVSGPDRGAVQHGMDTLEAAQAWCKAQMAAYEAADRDGDTDGPRA